VRLRRQDHAAIAREGTNRGPKKYEARELVRGDTVVLKAGDIVSADGRLLEVNHLYVDESALTGESAPALKSPRHGEVDPANEAGRDAFVFFGTSVVSGVARIELTATGARTSYGLIARRLMERAPRNDFERGVRSFGLLVSRVILLLVVGVFAADIALQRPLVESLLFAIALAVGLTPELLPAIVTVNLSRGARALARRGVLVKRLPAIQNLGSMTILCTDKTGTLTEGRLTFERAIGAGGEDAPEALSLAWLNSHFETGFTNPLDVAILATKAEPEDLAGYRKLAELPFDFERRSLAILVARPDGSSLLISKGAPEAILERSTSVRRADGISPIDDDQRARINALIAGGAALGNRAIAVASRMDLPGTELEPSNETGLVFEGLLLFSDPPKADIGARGGRKPGFATRPHRRMRRCCSSSAWSFGRWPVSSSALAMAPRISRSSSFAMSSGSSGGRPAHRSCGPSTGCCSPQRAGRSRGTDGPVSWSPRRRSSAGSGSS
jgi:Mg2+-importing ATPase